MNGPREALYGQFPTRKLVFTIILIARECNISTGGNYQFHYLLAEDFQPRTLLIQDYLHSAFFKLSFYNIFIYCKSLIYLTYGNIVLILYIV